MVIEVTFYEHAGERYARWFVMENHQIVAHGRIDDFSDEQEAMDRTRQEVWAKIPSLPADTTIIRFRAAYAT